MRPDGIRHLSAEIYRAAMKIKDLQINNEIPDENFTDDFTLVNKIHDLDKGIIISVPH